MTTDRDTVNADLDAVSAWFTAAESAGNLPPVMASLVGQLLMLARAAAAAGGIAPSAAAELHDAVRVFVRDGASPEVAAAPAPFRYDPPRLLTTGQAAAYLNRSPDVLRDWHDAGVLVATMTTPGGHRRYDSAMLDQRRDELAARVVRKRIAPRPAA